MLGIIPPIIFCIGPFVYFYTIALLQPSFRFKQKYYWHFLPCLLTWILLLPLYLLISQQKLALLAQENQRSGIVLEPFFILASTHALMYIIGVIWFLLKFRRSVSAVPTSLMEKKIRFGTGFITMNIALWISWVLANTYPIEFFKIADATLYSVLIFCISFLAFGSRKLSLQ